MVCRTITKLDWPYVSSGRRMLINIQVFCVVSILLWQNTLHNPRWTVFIVGPQKWKFRLQQTVSLMSTLVIGFFFLKTPNWHLQLNILFRQEDTSRKVFKYHNIEHKERVKAVKYRYNPQHRYKRKAQSVLKYHTNTTHRANVKCDRILNTQSLSIFEIPH